MENRAILEGLLFVVGEDGLNIEQIKDVLYAIMAKVSKAA